MTYIEKDRGIMVDEKSLDSLRGVEGIIFDCDGVLIDVSKSYDLAIKQTTTIVLKKFANIESIPITTNIINGFKDTGGFNDEVDVTYASILSLVAASKLERDPTQFIFTVIKNADATGIESVEKFLDSLNVDLSEIRKQLKYPGPHATNPLYILFDQIFYGPTLYEKIFQKKSQFSDPGLIENDLVIINSEIISELKKKFGNKLAIVTGRGKESTSYSLKKLIHEFDLDGSVFLEDEPRELAKPNPKSLIMSCKKLGISHCIFVGDSMEDLMMANDANKLGLQITFCGICGTNKDPTLKEQFFAKNHAPLILESVKKLPNALNLAN